MAIKIEMLRCFSSVAQTGNLADAAIRLGRTQSAVSMTLKQFEQHLGQRLFETERKNRLTPLGEEIFELAQQQVRGFDEAINTIETTAGAPRGLLRIASVPSMAGLVFPSAIEKLTRRNPEMIVELRDADTEQVIDALVRGLIDVGVASGEHSLNGIRAETLFHDTFGLVCAPDHPLARRGSAPTIEEVLASDFISNNLCNLIQAPEIRAALSTSNVRVHNTLSLIAMVRTGKWVTVLPQAVVQITPAEVIFQKVKGLEERRPVSLLTRERSRQWPLSEELCEIVRKFNWNDAIFTPPRTRDQRIRGQRGAAYIA